MLRRFFAYILIAFLPQGAAFALPAVPAPTAPYTVAGGLLDQVTKTSNDLSANRAQGLANFSISFHDDKYQYSMPLCSDPELVEVSGVTIDATSFIAGDTLVVSVKPNDGAKNPAKACANRIVRQKISRGASGGECLQDYQIKREIDNDAKQLIIKTDYSYSLSIYARPTLDCDRKAYGSAPITTVVAPGKPFVVTLTRDTSSGAKELKRWSLTTDSAGRANFAYTFTVPATYKFKLIPGATATPGDELTWEAKVVDPHPSPSPSPAAAASSKPTISTMPIIVLLVLVLIFGGAAEYRHWLKKKHTIESPEEEYNRASKL